MVEPWSQVRYGARFLGSDLGSGLGGGLTGFLRSAAVGWFRASRSDGLWVLSLVLVSGHLCSFRVSGLGLFVGQWVGSGRDGSVTGLVKSGQIRFWVRVRARSNLVNGSDLVRFEVAPGYARSNRDFKMCIMQLVCGLGYLHNALGVLREQELRLGCYDLHMHLLMEILIIFLTICVFISSVSSLDKERKRNQVRHANFFGLARGIARGGVPSARLAVYKLCEQDCDDIDILSAFDHAIADGVDIISISVGSDKQRELSTDPIAIGAFHAVERGILTVNAAGNKGPSLYFINTYAPWMFIVGASDIDRKIVDKLLLKNDVMLVGNAINVFSSSDEPLPLVYGKEVKNNLIKNCTDDYARKCVDGCLDPNLVNQKVVLCDQPPNFEELEMFGAIGYIFPTSMNVSTVMPFPAIALNSNDLNLVKIYKKSTTEPQVQIFKSKIIDNPGAPFVAAFSSRGPSIYMHDMIKPDVIAPGVEILAAFSPIGSPSGVTWDKNSVNFSILSGTSMACPHVIAAAAFVKSFHPEWSPSAIKSALMTTAFDLSASLYSEEAEFAYGSGHIHPLKAIDPGLIYETSISEYLKIWCNISQTLGSLNTTNASCPMKLTAKEINYPSMAVQVVPGYSFAVSFSRTVTNVGRANSTYIAHIEGGHSKWQVSVEPNTLHFSTINEKRNFVLTVKGNKMKPSTIKHMSLVWTDGVYRVRSPAIIYTASYGAKRLITPSMFYITFVLILLRMMHLYQDLDNYFSL